LRLALALLLASCGGSGDTEAAPKRLPACAKPPKTIAKPRALPTDLPVPPGTLFTSTEAPFSGQVVVSGVSPGTLESTRSFYDDGLEAAGYEEGRDESERGEVEAPFTGGGVRGGWRAIEIPGCDGAVWLTLVVVKT
jgi:hypothetical protein